MNITLTPEATGWIEQQIAAGRYADASEAIHEALHLLEEQSRFEELRAAIMAGYEEAERGELVPFDIEEAKRGSEEQARRGHRMNPLVLP